MQTKTDIITLKTKTMSHINFRPWVGKNYLSKGYKGKRRGILQTGKSWPYWHEVYEKFWELEVK